MRQAIKVGGVQGLKTAALGMLIMLSIPVLFSLFSGNLIDFFDNLINPKNWLSIIYIAVVTSFCGYSTGALAGHLIITRNKESAITGVLSSILSLILFGILRYMPEAVEELNNHDQNTLNIIGHIYGYTLLVAIVGLIPAIFVGLYLGNSINKKQLSLKL
jgi:hypothetical protein